MSSTAVGGPRHPPSPSASVGSVKSRAAFFENVAVSTSPSSSASPAVVAGPGPAGFASSRSMSNASIRSSESGQPGGEGGERGDGGEQEPYQRTRADHRLSLNSVGSNVSGSGSSRVPPTAVTPVFPRRSSIPTGPTHRQSFIPMPTSSGTVFSARRDSVDSPTTPKPAGNGKATGITERQPQVPRSASPSGSTGTEKDLNLAEMKNMSGTSHPSGGAHVARSVSVGGGRVNSMVGALNRRVTSDSVSVALSASSKEREGKGKPLSMDFGSNKGGRGSGSVVGIGLPGIQDEGMGDDDDVFDEMTEIEAEDVDEDVQAALTTVRSTYSSRLTKYKRLLEATQVNYASQLHALQAENRELKAARGKERREWEERMARMTGLEGVEKGRVGRRVSLLSSSSSGDVSSAVPLFDASVLTLRNGTFDEAAIKTQVRKLGPGARLKLVHIILDACMPGDIPAMQALLSRYVRSTFDIIGNMPDDVAAKVLERLEVRELLKCRLVSQKWKVLTQNPSIWRSYCLSLTATDPVPCPSPASPQGWEPLYRGLYYRERNWSRGLAQRIDLLNGHTNFVTSMQLKDNHTLVTGSYDESIRLWDLRTLECRKVLKAKAISCLDFLPEAGVLCAGLYDSGRVMVWSSKNWQLLNTLSGHNRGIRSVAINRHYLVSVGQDKAIVAWDWQRGTKVVRFGQQTNLSLGVSIVDRDKIVAVTVDGVIRTFSIAKRAMIGEYRLTKFGGDDRFLSSKLEGIGTSSTMLQWFAAHSNTMTVASKNLVVHLEWQETVVPEDEGAPTAGREKSGTKGLAERQASRSGTPVGRRTSTGRPTSMVAPSSTPPARSRTLSTASSASARSSIVRSTTMTREGSIKGSTGSPRVSSFAESPGGPLNQGQQQRSDVGGGDAPLSPSASISALPSPGLPRTRIAPNLAQPPKLVSLLQTPDMATGCTDSGKRRVVSATRFSSRTGADRRLFCSTFDIEVESRRRSGGGANSSGHGDGAEAGEDESGTGEGGAERTGDENDNHESVVPVRGAWRAMAGQLAVPTKNPMAMVLDHEKVIVGCADGTVYSMNFVGDTYGPKDDFSESEEGDEAVGDVSLDPNEVSRDLPPPASVTGSDEEDVDEEEAAEDADYLDDLPEGYSADGNDAVIEALMLAKRAEEHSAADDGSSVQGSPRSVTGAARRKKSAATSGLLTPTKSTLRRSSTPSGTGGLTLPTSPSPSSAGSRPGGERSDLTSSVGTRSSVSPSLSPNAARSPNARTIRGASPSVKVTASTPLRTRKQSGA